MLKFEIGAWGSLGAPKVYKLTHKLHSGFVSSPPPHEHGFSTGQVTCEPVPIGDGECRYVTSQECVHCRKRRERAQCYFCNSPDYLMYKCPSRHCAKCGKKGHSAKDYRLGQKVYHIGNREMVTDEHAVTLSVKFDDARVAAFPRDARPVNQKSSRMSP